MNELPIVADGQLATDAGAMVFGMMLYPTDPRSARQFAALLWEETIARTTSRVRREPYDEGQLFRKVLTGHNFPLLALVGHMALRIARGRIDGRSISKPRAAHVTSELFSNTKTWGGKPVPTEARRLEQTFDEFAPVVHLWGASAMVMKDADGSHLEGSEILSAIVGSRAHPLPRFA